MSIVKKSSALYIFIKTSDFKALIIQKVYYISEVHLYSLVLRIFLEKAAVIYLSNKFNIFNITSVNEDCLTVSLGYFWVLYVFSVTTKPGNVVLCGRPMLYPEVDDLSCSFTSCLLANCNLLSIIWQLS